MTLRRIGPLSTAKMMALLYALMGLLVGGILSIAALFGAVFGSSGGGPEDTGFSLVFGLGAVIILPVFYGLLGGLGGLVGAALYNLGAKLIGGIELQLDPA